MAIEPELLTAKQLSDYLGVSEASLAQDRYLSRGIPFVKVGKRVRYMRADVEDYLTAHRTEAGVLR
ncbi:helix-turn-helix domain-containing protein [Mycobacterium helveticum]|uniref:Helix-turn-helix domain-containing protein n=1 Tax=Mycobacterium helveticum TaxID=2592811 RepID=A0A557XX86_9MYCO|nr:helix-turn-helix domain-containing protein [Mycobacterium helveticum]TVS85547.1 helix-turn-helix domain-containing protein [Mycobacterium helveticum]TVS90719.1 helix-turn-helix domain-containing protein [Mycobacterium helveticum]